MGVMEKPRRAPFTVPRRDLREERRGGDGALPAPPGLCEPIDDGPDEETEGGHESKDPHQETQEIERCTHSLFPQFCVVR